MRISISLSLINSSNDIGELSTTLRSNVECTIRHTTNKNSGDLSLLVSSKNRKATKELVTNKFPYKLSPNESRNIYKLSNKESLSRVKRPISITLEATNGDGIRKFIEFLQWASQRTMEGTGITVNAEDNGGEKQKFYLDGDGNDFFTFKVKEQ